jgi:UDP-glucuronate 4-epimerase
LFNIGNSQPVKLIEYIEAIESALGKKAVMDMKPLQAGDVPDTFADTSELQKAIQYKPSTEVREGVAKFVNWYRDYYSV